MLAHLFKANLKREWILHKRYLPNTISTAITFYVIFMALFLGIKSVGATDTMESNIQYTLVNYIFWFLAVSAVQSSGWSVSREAQLGTLEQIYMTPIGAWLILLMRNISTLVFDFMLMVIITVAVMLTTDTWLHIDLLSILPILVFTVIGMFGLSFIIAGMAIIFKEISSFLQILQFILLGLTFIPLQKLPYLFFLPIVKGIDMERSVLIHHAQLSDFTMLDYTSLIGNAIFYFTLGVYVFKIFEKRALEKGVLGHH